MPEALLRQVNGWVYHWLGADGLLWFREHPALYTAMAAAVLAVLAALAAWLAWRAARHTGARFRRWVRRQRLALRLAATPHGRRGLRLARDIRRGARRLRRVASGAVEEPAERRALLMLLGRFCTVELDEALAHLDIWAALGRRRRLAALQGELAERTRRWSAAPDDDRRRALETAVARTRQQVALARRARADRRRLLEGLEEAAGAIHTLEAELVALGRARTAALPAFRAHLAELAEDFRAQRAVHMEFAPRPGASLPANHA